MVDARKGVQMQTQTSETKSKPAAAKKTAGKKPEKKEVEKKVDNRKITLLVKENPKKKGSEAHKRFAKYKNDMTVSDALAAGVTSLDISYDTKKKFIALSK
jgi:hypothetical protein